MLIEFDGFRIFHGSDSGFVESLKNVEPRVHVAIVPTGDPSPTASPQDALEMTHRQSICRYSHAWKS